MISTDKNLPDEAFEVSAEEKSKLISAIAEADRGEVVDAEEVLKRIRKLNHPNRS